MKYMTFNSSCSYAGIANMLEQYGVDTSDTAIALAMKLPYIFSFCNGVYLSGPMLQTSEWFDLYLNPIGYRMVEKSVSIDIIADYLKTHKTAMLGINIEGKAKHAVVYTKTEANTFVFVNNKWEADKAPEEIRLTIDELKQQVGSEVVVATIQQISPKNVNFIDKLKLSINVLQANLEDIIKLCDTQKSVASLRQKLNVIFRPLFLDGITMLELIGETELARDFESLQKELLCALGQEPEQNVLLKEYISIPKLQVSVQKYIKLIISEINTLQDK